MEWRARRAECTEAALAGRALDVDTLVAALEQLQHDIEPGNTPGMNRREHMLSICSVSGASAWLHLECRLRVELLHLGHKITGIDGLPEEELTTYLLCHTRLSLWTISGHQRESKDPVNSM